MVVLDVVNCTEEASMILTQKARLQAFQDTANFIKELRKTDPKQV